MDEICTCPSARSRSPDTARALARVDALHRTIVTMSSKTSQSSIFREGTQSKFPRPSLGKFNATTATSNWPELVPQTPPMYRLSRDDTISSSRVAYRSDASDLSSRSNSPSPSPKELAPPTKRLKLVNQSESRSSRVERLVKPLESISLQRCEQKLPNVQTLLNARERSGSPTLPTDSHRMATHRPKLPLPRIRTDLPPGETLLSRPTQDLPEDDRNWLHYADPVKTGRGTNEWHCLWREQVNGVSTSCGYVAKKQLMKRHVETTHLKMKPFQCDYCDCRFPQKTSLNVHTASKHTRDNPYKCPFDGCATAFNDPARLHRHKTDVHGYVPKLTIRCKKNLSVA